MQIELEIVHNRFACTRIFRTGEHDSRLVEIPQVVLHNLAFVGMSDRLSHFAALDIEHALHGRLLPRELIYDSLPLHGVALQEALPGRLVIGHSSIAGLAFTLLLELLQNSLILHLHVFLLAQVLLHVPGLAVHHNLLDLLLRVAAFAQNELASHELRRRGAIVVRDRVCILDAPFEVVEKIHGFIAQFPILALGFLHLCALFARKGAAFFSLADAVLALEENWLRSWLRPLVLLQRRNDLLVPLANWHIGAASGWQAGLGRVQMKLPKVGLAGRFWGRDGLQGLERGRLLSEVPGGAGRLKQVVMGGHGTCAGQDVVYVDCTGPSHGLCPVATVLIELVDDILHSHVLISCSISKIATLVLGQDITYSSICRCRGTPALARRLERRTQA